MVLVLGWAAAAVTGESTNMDASTSEEVRSHSLRVWSLDAVRHLLLGRVWMADNGWVCPSSVECVVRFGRLRTTMVASL